MKNELDKKNDIEKTKLFMVFLASAFLLMWLLVPFAKGEDLVYKQNSIIDLKIPCYNNGTWCSAGAVCNITINYPNGTNMVYQGLMTNQISFHNYTLNDSSINGVYAASMVCNDGGVNGKSTFAFYITPDGSAYSSTKNTMFVVFTIFFLLLTTILFILGIKSSNLIEMSLAVIAAIGFLFFTFQTLMTNPAVIATNFYDMILVGYKIFSILAIIVLSASPIFIIWGIILEVQKKKGRDETARGIE